MPQILTIENQLQQKNDDYFNLYQKLKQWAVDQWTDHNDVPEQIRHDVSHSDAMMVHANTILQNKLKSDYLTEKELFLFAASIYLHDIGMQYGWKEHLDIQGDRGNLSAEERKKIRINHAMTSGNVIRSFISNLPQSLDDNLSLKQKQILYDLCERLAFVAESHNQPAIVEHLKQCATLFPENKLKIDLLAALLQFCDTMHMDKSRLNESRFRDDLAKWVSGKPLESAYEPKDWQRFFQSHYVESVRLLYVGEPDIYEIQVDVRFNPGEDTAARDRFLNIYRGRLERRKHDCLEVLRTHNIRFTGDYPFNLLEAESSKIVLPQVFTALFTQLEQGIANTKHAPNAKKTIKDPYHVDLLTKYCDWRCATTATYVIPGIRNTPLPIDSCWLSLSTTELPLDNLPPQSPREQLDQYMKMGKSDTGREEKYDAEWMGEGLRQLVIVGGPGSGKSLLLQRIAHREAKTGRTVLLAKLKYIASEMRRENVPFEEALESIVTTGFSCSDIERQTILQVATLLLLDGLDECGGQRGSLAAEIVNWSVSHPEITIIISTRPVGHAPATLPHWPHFLLGTKDHKFSEFAIDGVCKEVFKGQQELIAKVENRLNRVIYSGGGHKENKDYKAIKEVPLLFSFVVSLAVNGCDIPDQRMELYRDVIKLLAKDDVIDRDVETKVDASEAYLFLHHLAWMLMEDPVIDYDALMEKGASLFAAEFGVSKASAYKASERTFQFWEERRLLERLHHGAGDIVAFMHLGFCEYAAAKHLENLNPETIKSWVVLTREDAHWKEVYLNAASQGHGKIIIETLLELDRPAPPGSKDAIFAAELAAITEDLDKSILLKLLQHILQRITSAYPFIAYDAAKHLLPIARKFPDLVGPQYTPLLNHENEWTRFSALALCIESGKKYVDLPELQAKYPELIPQFKSTMSPFGGVELRELVGNYDLKTAIVIGSTKILLSEAITADLLERVKRMYDNNLSMGHVSELSKVLKESGNPELIQIAEEHDKSFWGRYPMPKLFDEDDKPEQIRFLDLVLTTCPTVDKSIINEKNRPFIHFSKIVRILSLLQMPAGDFWNTLLVEGKEDQLQFAIRGATLAAGVPPVELAKDIIVLKRLLETEGHHYFFGLLPDFPFSGDWTKCSDLCTTDPELLAMSLTHPCDAVALAAAETIYEGAINEPLKMALENVFRKSRFRALYFISMIAARVWGDKVLGIVLSRLEQELTPGCQHLIKKLPDYSRNNCDDRILAVIKRALEAESEEVAEAAAKLCLDFIPSEQLLLELKAALTYWKKHEKPYPTSGGVIPPSPRAKLLKALILRNGLSFDEFVELYGDSRSDVKDIAKSSLLQLAKENNETVTRMLDLIETGRFGSTTLWSLMELPYASLKHEHTRLLKLLDSEDPDIQVVMFAALKRHPLHSEADAVRLLRSKLDSSNTAVREAAIKALSHFDSQTS